ncbi:MAG: hypothetical protein JNM58_09870 [Xanthomonadaceae bacterium]|nr:hypothetical protein [Xanthomonadaceae bacterium]
MGAENPRLRIWLESISNEVFFGRKTPERVLRAGKDFYFSDNDLVSMDGFISVLLDWNSSIFSDQIFYGIFPGNRFSFNCSPGVIGCADGDFSDLFFEKIRQAFAGDGTVIVVSNAAIDWLIHIDLDNDFSVFSVDASFLGPRSALLNYFFGIREVKLAVQGEGAVAHVYSKEFLARLESSYA